MCAFKSGLKAEEMAEAEDPEEREEEDEDEAVPVKNESYVNLRKKAVQKHCLKMDNVLQENRKLCRDFQRKQVNRGSLMSQVGECGESGRWRNYENLTYGRDLESTDQSQ